MCVVNGMWGAWGPFGACALKGGKRCERNRKRVCDDPMPSNGGAKCTGDRMLQYNYAQCKANSCGKLLYTIRITEVILYVYILDLNLVFLAFFVLFGTYACYFRFPIG